MTSTEMPLSPEDRKHHCTDVPALALLLLGLLGLGSLQAYARQHGDAEKLVRGFDYRNRMCGIDVPGKGLLYWCRDPFGQIELNYPVCVAACPGGTQGVVSCFDIARNDTTLVPTYKTFRLGTLCLPAGKRESRALLRKVVGRRQIGMIARAVTTMQQSWELVVCGGLAGIAVAYVYVRVLQCYAAKLFRVSMFCLVVGPLTVGTSYLLDGASGGSDGKSSTGDSSLNLWIGSGLVGLGLLMAAVWCFFRGLETAVRSIEAAAEVFEDEVTIILAPFVSFASKVLLLADLVRGLILLASCGEVKRSNPFGILRTLDTSLQLELFMAAYVFATCWLLELTNAVTEYAVAWTTQRWYFTPPVDECKGRAHNGGVCRAYGNALRFHLGSIALGSLVIMVMRPLRLALSLITQAAQDCRTCLGACVVQACSFLVAVNQEIVQQWDRCAYVDIAISSEGFCRSASRASRLISNQVPAVAALRGAHLIFTVSGVGFTCVVPVVLIWGECLVANYLGLEETFNPRHKKWILLAVGLVCLSIGFTFMLAFDVVAESVLYCFALDQRQHKRRKRSRRKHDSMEAHGQGTTMYRWLFNHHTTVATAEERVIEYAPQRLRDLINSQDNLYH